MDRPANGSPIAFTWQQFRNQVIKLADALAQLRIQHGTVVAILLPTGFAYEQLTHALMRLGSIVVGIDCQASPEDIATIARRCQAAVLLTDASMYRGCAGQLPASVTAVVLTDWPPQDAPVDTKKVWHLSQLLNEARSEARPANAVAVRGGDWATIVFTSGTTGEPKGIPYRHEQIMAACHALVEAYNELGPADDTICWLPLSALFQRMVNLVSMACGMRTHYLADPRHILAAISEIRPSFLVGVPRFFEKLSAVLEDPAHEQLRHSARSVKYMISGSAPLPRAVLEKLYANGILVLEAYGLSEDVVPIAVNRATEYRFGSVGKPLAPNRIRLAEDGEVEVQGIGVFSGYLGQAQPDAFTVDGYYRSGDLGTFDADGFLFLTGRKRDLIKTSTGRRIAPSRIEAAYAHCRYIDQIVVIGDGRKYLAALLTLKAVPSSQATGEAATAERADVLLSELRAADHGLSEHERVQAFGILGRPFQGDELTTSQKLKRDVITRKYAALIDRLYSYPTPCVVEAHADELPP
ncbi:MAG: AMP-dependent synthetase/ligase [Aureliella sp.]